MSYKDLQKIDESINDDLSSIQKSILEILQKAHESGIDLHMLAYDKLNKITPVEDIFDLIIEGGAYFKFKDQLGDEYEQPRLAAFRCLEFGGIRVKYENIEVWIVEILNMQLYIAHYFIVQHEGIILPFRLREDDDSLYELDFLNYYFYLNCVLCDFRLTS